MSEDAEEKIGIGPGMPAAIFLEQFGAIVRAAFGDCPYQVGSTLKKKTGWRDVDVRLIIEDEEWERLFGKIQHPYRYNPRWALICGAIALLGQRMTGLPIDFQIEPRTEANKDRGPRSALGLMFDPREKSDATE